MLRHAGSIAPRVLPAVLRSTTKTSCASRLLRSEEGRRTVLRSLSSYTLDGSLHRSPLAAPPERRFYSSTSINPSSFATKGRWVAPAKRATSPLPNQRRPLVNNGRAIPLHINDLVQREKANGIRGPPPPLQKRRQYESDLIVVLDMDECLIHSQFFTSQNQAQVYAYQLRQQQQQLPDACQAPCESFRVSLPDGEWVHVNVRPGLYEFLNKVTCRYETHVFTAAMEIYAKPVLEHLQQQSGGEFASVYYREHCTWDPTASAYVKDFSRLPHLPLDRTVLVDNNPLSFLAQPENGILVSSFYHDGTDETLSAVHDLLDELEGVQDVRPVLSRKFGLKRALQRQAAAAEQEHDESSSLLQQEAATEVAY